MPRIIDTEGAPAAIGAYSQATTDGSLVFTAGQIPATPAGEVLSSAPIERQTKQALENCRAILEAADCSFSSVLKATIYLEDIEDFEAVNETYASYFEEDPPARSAIGVEALPKGVGIEIEMVATTA